MTEKEILKKASFKTPCPSKQKNLASDEPALRVWVKGNSGDPLMYYLVDDELPAATS